MHFDLNFKSLFAIITILFLCSCATLSEKKLATMTISERWNLIRNGLTQQQVIKILGTPSSKQKWSDQTTFEYYKDSTCNVTFGSDGRVWSYNSPKFK